MKAEGDDCEYLGLHREERAQPRGDVERFLEVADVPCLQSVVPCKHTEESTRIENSTECQDEQFEHQCRGEKKYIKGVPLSPM